MAALSLVSWQPKDLTRRGKICPLCMGSTAMRMTERAARSPTPKFETCCVNTTYCYVLTVNNRIALFRSDRGVSRRALAEAVGVNPQTIGYLERGDYNPSLELGLKIAAFFGVPVEMVFSLTAFPSLSDTLRTTGVTSAGENR